MLRFLGARGQDLEDLAHDVFVVVHQRLGDYDASRPVRPWLFGIAWKVAARHHDRLGARVEVPTAEPPDRADGAPGADDRIAQHEAWALVQRALEDLDLDQRGVFVMHDIEAHSAPEIAAALEVPLNTVYSRLRLGRERFARAVRRLTKGAR